MKIQCKKTVSAILFFMIIVSSMSAVAFYGPGDLTISLGDITLEAGETKSVSVSLPFEAGSMSYTADTDNPLIELKTDRQTILLGSSAVTSNDGSCIFPRTERQGEYTWQIVSQNENVVLRNVVIHRFNDKSLSNFSSVDYQAPECELTEEELAVSTALLINLDASCIIVNGARRYINYSVPNERPLIADGSIYLPARTLALALGCYSEVIPSKNYIFVRDDANAREFYFTTSYSYEQKERGIKKNIPYHAIFADGEAYLPVRGISELLGKTVIYNERIVVIADKKYANKIIDTHFNYAVSLFEGFTSQAVSGTTYHVSQESGNDGNNGTSKNPYKTITKAASVAGAGDTVIIHKGTYREVLKPVNNGTPTSPIVFKAAEGERVVITATKAVTDFVPYGTNGLIMADVEDIGEGRNQIYYNGTAIAEARYPDGPLPRMSERSAPVSSLYPVIGADLKVQDRTDAENKARTAVVKSDTLLNQEDNYWQGGTYLSVHGYAYSLSGGKIASSIKGQLNLVETPYRGEYWYNPSTNSTWNYGFITGHVNAINQPGEWVVNDGKLIMLPPEGENADTLTVEMKSKQLVIDLADRKFIKVEGIETLGGSAKMNNSEMCILSDMDMKYISHYTQSADQRDGYLSDPDETKRKNAKNVPCEPQKGEVGIYISGRDNAVLNSRIDHSAAAALYLTGLYTYVDNNIMSNCGYMGSYVCGITCYPDPWMSANEKKGGHSLYNNTVYNCGRHPFKIQALETTGLPSYSAFLPLEIAYNDFHDGNLFTLDTGMIYVYHANASTREMRSRVHSNYVYYTLPYTHPYSQGIYFDGGSMGFNAYNNMVFTTEKDTVISGEYVFRQTKISDCTFSNNSKITKAIENDVSSLTAELFPKGKPFYAGSFLDKTEPYNLNYQKLDESVTYYEASGENVSYDTGAVQTSDGGLTLPGKDKTITFNDVEFNSNINTVNLYFGGDRYGRTSNNNDVVSTSTGVKMEVIIGDKDTSANKHEFTLTTRAENLYEPDFVSIYTNNITGIYDVHIRQLDNADSLDTRIYGILLSDSVRDIPDHNGSHIEAVDYNSVYKNPNGTKSMYDSDGSYVKNTNTGTVLWYKDVKIDELANYLKIAICHKTSAPESSPITRTVNIYKGSYTSANKIATYSYTMGYEDGTWNSPQIQYQEISPVAAGTYDLYVEFKGTSTSNFFSFGFTPEKPSGNN